MLELELVVRRVKMSTQGLLSLKLSRGKWHFDIGAKAPFDETVSPNINVSFRLPRESPEFDIYFFLQETLKSKPRLAGISKLLLSPEATRMESSVPICECLDPRATLEYTMTVRAIEQQQLEDESYIEREELNQKLQEEEARRRVLLHRNKVLKGSYAQFSNTHIDEQIMELRAKKQMIAIKMKTVLEQSAKEREILRSKIEGQAGRLSEMMNVLNWFGNAQMCDAALQEIASHS